MSTVTDDDYLLALQMSEIEDTTNWQTFNARLNDDVHRQEKDDKSNLGNDNNRDITASLVDPSWELIDPTPNIHSLFLEFDRRFFGGKLCAVEVSWSSRMTVCAGLCSYEARAHYCSIRLSHPLLKLRPRKDLIETLLHEMIHAYLFVTLNYRDREDHGPRFHEHMYRINKLAGTNITVYHTFHDEVKSYQTHWWKCNGPCRDRHPFYGLVKRSMNRAPGPYDFWWAQHEATCGGRFIKIKEPENYGVKKKGNNNNKPSLSVKQPKNDISQYLVDKRSNNSLSKSKGIGDGNLPENLPKDSFSSTSNDVSGVKLNDDNNIARATNLWNSFKPFTGAGQTLGGDSSRNKLLLLSNDTNKLSLRSTSPMAINRRKDDVTPCPVCNRPVLQSELWSHLENCSDLANIFEDEHEMSVEKDNDDNDTRNEMHDSIEYAACPCCERIIRTADINVHLDNCLTT